MTRTQKIERQRSQWRERMKALADIEARSEAEQAELIDIEGNYVASEVELRTAQHLDQQDRDAADTGEGRDTLTELEKRAFDGGFAQGAAAALTGSRPTGALAEYNAERGLGEGELSVRMLPSFRQSLEKRTTTDISPVQSSEQIQPVIQPVHAASMLRTVDMVMVDAGVQS